MTIRVGDTAPDHRVEAYERGQREATSFSLSDHRGRWVILFFYPRDFTFICPTELAAFADRHADFVRERARWSSRRARTATSATRPGSSRIRGLQMSTIR
jgi:alkyl hydroperoxide reductase subunit AhpC